MKRRCDQVCDILDMEFVDTASCHGPNLHSLGISVLRWQSAFQIGSYSICFWFHDFPHPTLQLFLLSVFQSSLSEFSSSNLNMVPYHTYVHIFFSHTHMCTNKLTYCTNIGRYGMAPKYICNTLVVQTLSTDTLNGRWHDIIILDIILIKVRSIYPFFNISALTTTTLECANKY